MRIKEFARQLGVTTETVRRWDREGKLVAKRTMGNHRYYTERDLLLARGMSLPRRKTIVYCRVSSFEQKEQLINQRLAMEKYCQANNYQVDRYVEEIGSGLNFRRPKFLALFEEALSGEIETILIAYREKLARSAFELLEELLLRRECQIVAAFSNPISPYQKSLEDFMAVSHFYTSQLYGARDYSQVQIGNEENPIDRSF